MGGFFLILPCRVIIEEMLSQIKGSIIVTSLKQLNGYFYRYAVSVEKFDVIVDRYVGGSMNM